MHFKRLKETKPRWTSWKCVKKLTQDPIKGYTVFTKKWRRRSVTFSRAAQWNIMIHLWPAKLRQLSCLFSPHSLIYNESNKDLYFPLWESSAHFEVCSLQSSSQRALGPSVHTVMMTAGLALRSGTIFWYLIGEQGIALMLINSWP